MDINLMYAADASGAFIPLRCSKTFWVSVSVTSAWKVTLTAGASSHLISS